MSSICQIGEDEVLQIWQHHNPSCIFNLTRLIKKTNKQKVRPGLNLDYFLPEWLLLCCWLVAVFFFVQYSLSSVSSLCCRVDLQKRYFSLHLILLIIGIGFPSWWWGWCTGWAPARPPTSDVHPPYLAWWRPVWRLNPGVCQDIS